MSSRLPRILLAAAVVLAAVLLPLAGPSVSADAPQTQASSSYDWYRYQGSSESGPSASVNCEVTSMAMAIQYARNNLRIPISTIRQFLGKDGPTVTADAQRVLAHWDVPFQGVQTVGDIMNALARGHIVMVGLVMSRISPGADYEHGNSPPSQRFGRYYSYEGAHSVVVKGVTSDKGWFIVYDPDVWDGNSTYWYSDGTPKGKDRYYPVGEFARAMNDLGDSPRGLEILAVPGTDVALQAGAQAQPVSLVQDASSTPLPSVPDPRQSGDLAVLCSLVSSWRSVTLAFRMTNPRSDAIPIAQIGVQGRDPTGQEFFAAQGPVTLQPGDDLDLAIPMAVQQTGVWHIYRILYYAEGQWHELAASGYLQQMDFTVQ